MSTSQKSTKETTSNHPECFIIMPISPQEGYSEEHFSRVYEDIVQPACQQAQTHPQRADDNKGTNLIQLEILKKLLDAPIALCDLSSRNPNVFFELGIRQAFDKPVILIKDEKTPPAFDINGLRYIQYSSLLTYRDVIATQKQIAEAINETISQNKGSINSIVQLLAMQKAFIPDSTDSPDEQILRLILAKLTDLEKSTSKDHALRNEQIKSVVEKLRSDEKQVNNLISHTNRVVRNDWGSNGMDDVPF